MARYERASEGGITAVVPPLRFNVSRGTFCGIMSVLPNTRRASSAGGVLPPRHWNTTMKKITCRECGEVKPQCKPRYLVCRECHCAKRRAKRAENPEWYRGVARARYHGNPAENVKRKVRARIRCTILDAGGTMAYAPEHYLGYPVARIVAWVEKQGGIPRGYEFDHIVSFAEMRRRYPGDILRQQREAWKLVNLRLIPAPQNRAKSAEKIFLA